MKKILYINLFIIIVGILFILSPIISNYHESIVVNGEVIDLENDNVKLSKISGKIHIDNNWTDARDAGICTGNGTYSNPYVIEDVVIDGGGFGSCIWIEHSDVYFRIENCTVYNSGEAYDDAGIILYYVNNSQLVNNNCSFNSYGILIEYSYNNTISGNIVNNNEDYGICLYYSDNNIISGNNVCYNGGGIAIGWSNNNKISGNIANENDVGIELYRSNNNNISGNIINSNNWGAIYLKGCTNNSLSGNIMSECGLRIYGSSEELGSHDIDTTNLVNDKSLYYHVNEVNLGPINFTNAGQVILVNCNDSLIKNLNISYSTIGISLHHCHNNNISGNTAKYNYMTGIYLSNSDNNNVLRNIADHNNRGVCLYFSSKNLVSGNTANYNRESGMYLSNSDNNTILGNTANNNYIYGIFLQESNNNMIMDNNFIGNYKCWEVYFSEGNIFINNNCLNKEKKQIIPGFNLFFLLGILSVVVILISKKLKKP